jgi:hypothetical protein
MIDVPFYPVLFYLDYKVMIYEALSCLTDEINVYFRSRLKINEEKIVLSGLVNQDGTIAIQGENKIVVTLVNIEKETSKTISQKNLGSFSSSAPPLHLNAYVLFSAYFSGNNYPEALRFLSFIIAYFQNKPVFNKGNTPSLDNRIDKLIFDMEDVNPDTLSNMWSTLGAKYMPSVLYKMRMLTFDESVIREFRPAISKVADDNKIMQE